MSVAIGRLVAAPTQTTTVAPKLFPSTTATMDNKEKTSKLAAHDGTMPLGLCSAISRSVADFPMRFMIVDNSGSMQTADGHRLVPVAGGAYRSISCTRWEELSHEVVDVASLASAIGTRLDVHMLNARAGCGAMSICTDAWPEIPSIGATVPVSELRRAILSQSPFGTTPLTEAVMNIASMLEGSAAEALRARGERVVVIVATDGLPNDKHSFLQAMKYLQTLPTWVVVRLCTDDESVVEYWNELDAQLEAPLEVLDDVKGEAMEVSQLNGWLTYGPALHLARLFGLPGQLYDSLDEVSLVPTQIKAFIEDVLGCDVLPEPQIDPQGFLLSVKQALAAVPDRQYTWDPHSGRLKPWLDERALARAMRSGARCLKKEGCALM